jgi:hypothetical protein
MHGFQRDFAGFWPVLAARRPFQIDNFADNSRAAQIALVRSRWIP